MSEAATQLDIDRLRDDMGRTWADVRDSLKRHEDADDTRFLALTKQVVSMEKLFATWTGALAVAKWTLGLGMPTIVGLLITHLVRHWTN